MEFSENVQLLLAAIAMGIGVLLALVPFLPATLMVWGIGTLTAYLTGFDRVTVLAVIVMTIIMLLTQTRDFWLPLFGVKMAGLSCLTSVGTLAGGLIGAFVIPIPILNALIGSVIGAAVVEIVMVRRLARGVTAGKTAAKLFAISYVLELTGVGLVFLTFLISVAVTA
jgi:uncharacterized protein